MSERISLANRTHLALVLGIMLMHGDVCDECGHGTRKTSKRWAKCKNCGNRCERRTIHTDERTAQLLTTDSAVSTDTAGQ